MLWSQLWLQVRAIVLVASDTATNVNRDLVLFLEGLHILSGKVYDHFL